MEGRGGGEDISAGLTGSRDDGGAGGEVAEDDVFLAGRAEGLKNAVLDGPDIAQDGRHGIGQDDGEDVPDVVSAGPAQTSGAGDAAQTLEGRADAGGAGVGAGYALSFEKTFFKSKARFALGTDAGGSAFETVAGAAVALTRAVSEVALGADSAAVGVDVVALDTVGKGGTGLAGDSAGGGKQEVVESLAAGDAAGVGVAGQVDLAFTCAEGRSALAAHAQSGVGGRAGQARQLALDVASSGHIGHEPVNAHITDLFREAGQTVGSAGSAGSVKHIHSFLAGDALSDVGAAAFRAEGSAGSAHNRVGRVGNKGKSFLAGEAGG